MTLPRSATCRAPTAMVSTVDQLATEAALDVLRAGGSAADGAMAANAVLTVTSPHLCGMGGDLFALVHHDDAAPPAVLNASGRAGAGADPARLRAEGRSAMPFRGDVRSAPVPGCVDGWLALHERFGRLPLERVLAAAIGYAEDGFPASPLLAALIPLVDGIADNDDLRGPMATGQRVRRPGSARALRAIADSGRDGFYGGEFGEALLALGAGEYLAADLEGALSDWVVPLRARLWGHDVWTVPPNSQGYLALAAGWMAERLDLPTEADDPRWPHLLVEASRQAAHDRSAVLWDGADGAALLEPERLAPRLRSIDPDRAATLGDRYAGGGTMALTVIDGSGMGVSLIQSNAADFGAHVAVPGTGILLHNRGIGFSLEPGHPAELAPGRRPPHTLSPLLVTRPDGALRAVLGTMGGDSQPQVLLQLLVRLLAMGQSPAAALDAARWVLASDAGSGFDTWAAGGEVVVRIEDGAPEGWDDGLRERGHTVDRQPPAGAHGFGHAHIISVEPDHLAGAADPRALIGAAAGY